MKSLRTCLLALLFTISILPALAGVPERIISLAPSITQSLYAMGAQDRLVGCTSYCYPAIEDGKTVVGTATQVNIEKALSLKPDLVLASSFTKPEEMEMLRKFGVEVLLLESPHSYDEICEQFVALGEAVGKKPRAAQIVENSRTIVRKISERRKEKASGTPPTLFFQIGANPLFAVIPETFMDDYIRFLGCTNITKELKHGQVTEEFVVKENPDYILIATMGSLTSSERMKWLRLSSLKAARHSRVYVIDAALACEPSPVTFAQTMTVLDRLINEY